MSSDFDIDPAKDPIPAARQWFDGCEYRLSEADRARHLPGATSEQYLKMVNWALDPKRDKCHAAVDILLERIRAAENPPYPADVLLMGYEALEAIPLTQRLAQYYFPRMLAWLDRVEAWMLSIEKRPKNAARDLRSPAMSLEQFAAALVMDPRVFKNRAEAEWDLQSDGTSGQRWTVSYMRMNEGTVRRIEAHAEKLAQARANKRAKTKGAK